MDNKVKGALVALVGSLCMGGAQLMGMENRIAVLEEAAGIEPEPAEEAAGDEPEAEATEEPESAPEATEEPESSEE